MCYKCKEFVILVISVLKCLCIVGVFTLWFVPLEGQFFINFQRSMFGICAMSGAIAFYNVEHEISILYARVSFTGWLLIKKKVLMMAH